MGKFRRPLPTYSYLFRQPLRTYFNFVAPQDLEWNSRKSPSKIECFAILLFHPTLSERMSNRCGLSTYTEYTRGEKFLYNF